MNRSLFVLLVLLATSLMGSSFAVGKVGLSYVSPLLLVGIRFALAGGIMALAVRLQRRRLPDNLRDWTKLLLVGACQTTAVMGCIFLSMRSIPAGETSILTFMNPLFVVVLGVLFMRLQYRFHQWAGVVVGFAGVVVTLGSHMQLSTGTLLGLGSAIAWAIATLLVKKWGSGFDRWVLTAYQMLFGGLLLLVLACSMETPRLDLNWTSLGVILYLAILGSIVQFATWYYLLAKGDPGRTSAFLFLAPFFGALSGWLILGEVIRWYAYAGGLLIFVGIFLVNWTSRVTKN
ncbi:DMT family transporter [Paenibacillus methanolicus]|uniref:Threonine/homoserine efflux transporter RhtA n=1 Tax=Paenibacillus methanolicus TaxID=582686 RepID=A0A5S5C9T7_9BACL|nr:DMT family transporter [Paenibacillus methanolicus]TYP75388.1 threonine/homoserine efflux transporter RhtA [Paenibacillus methanolicus]